MANKQDVDLKFSIIDGVTKFITDLKVAIKGVGTSFTELNQLSELVGKGFDKIAAAAGKIGDAVAGAAAFEEALARVGARTDATIDQQVALQQAVENAVSATTFSVTEAADALAALAEDGFSAKEAADQLGSVLTFANAAAIDAAESTGLLGTILDKFAAAPDEIGGIADALTATAGAAGASTKAIAEGLAGVGTAAKAANISIADSVAVLGTLAVEGVESSAAVSRLNKIFQDFAEPASKFSVAIREAGLGGLEFVDVVAALQKDSAAASDVLATLGDKPREAMRLLLQEGGSDLESFTAIIDKSGGAAQAAADKLNNTFNGALTKLINQVDLARTKLLLPILAPLTKEFEGLNKDITEFVDSDEFAKISEQVRVFVEKTVTAIKSVDFGEALQALGTFASGSLALATGVIKTFNDIAGAIQLAVDAAKKLEEIPLAGDFGGLAKAQAELAEAQRKAKEEAAAYAAESQRLFNELNKQPEKLYEVSDATTGVTTSTFNMTAEVKAAAKPVDAFGNTLSDIGKTAEKAKAGLFNMTAGLEKVNEEARKSEIRNLETEYGRLLVAAGKGADNSGELAQVRNRLQEISQSGDQAGQGAGAAKDGIDGASDAANNGRITFTSYGGEAGNVAEQSDRLAESSDRVAESLEGVADAASQSGKAFETNSALGEKLTAAFLNASSDFGNYQQFFFQNLKNINDQAKIGNEALKEAVKLSELRDPQLQREVEIRKQLLEQYQVGGPELDKLVAIRVKEAEAADNEKLKQEAEQRDAVNKKVTESTKTLDEITAARERERKEREASLAVGAQELAQNQQLVATQPKPGSTNNVTINVNITGSQDSQAYWRRVVSEFILPELKRLERLEQ